MSADCVLIVGGAEDQLPAYHEARRMGYRVIGVDANPHALGSRVADEFHAITVRDPAAIATAIGAARVKAVVTLASDTALPAVAWLGRHYATHAVPSAMTVNASVDKGHFRRLLDRLALPSYPYVSESNSADLFRAAQGLSFPMVVKPIDASGSKGTALVDDQAQLAAAIKQVWPFSHSGLALVEQAVAGRHGSIECFLLGGEVRFSAATERQLTAPPFLISTSHTVPAALEPEQASRLVKQVTMVCAELGHRDGPVNLDFVIAGDGEIYLIEFGARIGGAGLPLLIQQAYGVNTVAAAIALSAARPVELTPTCDRAAGIAVLHSEYDGRLVSFTDPAQLRAQLPGVLEVRLFAQVGDPVRAYTQAAHKLGYLILAADDTSALAQLRQAALARLALTIDTTPTIEAL